MGRTDVRSDANLGKHVSLKKRYSPSIDNDIVMLEGARELNFEVTLKGLEVMVIHLLVRFGSLEWIAAYYLVRPFPRGEE